MGSKRGAVGAVIGGGIGGAIGGPVGAGIGASIGGGLAESFGGDAGAGAAEAAALAQQSTASRAYADVTKLGKEATTAGLANYDKALALQEKHIAGQEKLISQIDPTILEASQQALKLLKGESASTLAPMQAQRAQQRQKLLNSLREQLGPGAETSSIGQQALANFDLESQGLTSQAQQQALGTVGNIFGQFSSQRPDLGQSAMGIANLEQGRAGLQFQQAGLTQQAYQPLLQTAGAQYTASALRGQQQAQMGQMLLGGGLQALGGLGGGAGKA